MIVELLAVVATAADASGYSGPFAPGPNTLCPRDSIVFGFSQLADAPNAHYPVQALNLRAQGRTILDCTARGDGGLDRCKVIYEKPQNLGFADAALQIAKDQVDRLPPKFRASRLCIETGWEPFSGPVIVAPPPSSADPARAIAHPGWVRRPAGGDIMNFYPPQALEAGIEGHSSMECTVTDDGALTACHVTSETPAGKGFGSAELRLASRFRMKPQGADGKPTAGGKVTIPLSWKIATPPPPPPDPAPH
jgi:TonB family protein